MMSSLQTILPILSELLEKLKSLEVVKEFSFESLQLSNGNIEEIANVCKKFVNEANLICDATEQIDIETSVKSNMDIKISEEKKPATPFKRMIQLQADEDEIHRRITAFVSRKRKEIDESNIREFCSQQEIPDDDTSWENVFSCARVDAAYIPRSGSKSHVKVSKVENRWGPQTQGPKETLKKIKTEPGIETENVHTPVSFDAVNERLQNMESHLNLKSENPVRITSFQQVFQRLKQLENRILFLEGISPDYFHFPDSNTALPKKNIQEKEKLYATWTIDDIQKRMQALRESLRAKSAVKKEVQV